MNRSLDAIQRVIDAFERSDWSEIDVRSGDVRVHLVAGPTIDAGATTPAPRREPAPEVQHGLDQPTARSAVPDASSLPDGAHIVKAPSPGIFWRAPEPGAPPFAEVGDIVESETTMCIIEVMKLMSHLKAGIRGEVSAVYGRNGVAVDSGEPLFAITPLDPTS